MNSTRSFRIHHELVVHDVLDGEVLAIRNDTGTYYSLAGTAADVWVALADGLDEAGVVRALDARYEAAAGEIPAAVSSFLDQLAAECLIVSSDVPTTAGVAPDGDGPRVPFATPELQVFTDMQDLLLFDPIHEVGPAGWPQVSAPPDSTTPAP